MQANSTAISQTASTKHGIILILAAVMPAMAIISLVPVLPLLMAEFSMVEGYEVLVPIAMTIPALCVAIFSPLAGWISDKVGRKPVLFYALIAYSFIGVLPYFLTDLFHIIFARIALGIAEAAIMTVATALIADYFQGKKRERWVAIQVASVSLSAIVLIAIGGILGETLGSRGPFLLYVLAIPVAYFVATTLFEPSYHSDTSIPDLHTFPLLRILPLLLTTLFVGIIFYSMIVKLGAILALTSEVTPAQIGLIGAAANVGVALGSLLFNKLKQHSGPLLTVIGLSLSTLGYFGASQTISLTVTSISAFIACLGFGILLPTMLTWVLQLLPPKVRGKGTGLWTGVFFLGQFAAPIIITVLQNALSGLASVLLLLAVLCFSGVLLALIKMRGAKSLATQNTKATG
ncbi:MFS transporter [Shewanella sp. UCD-KL21]|uniref:MFS transporter n=1 Tax=Shewanella sp. UCD-KL21 TaxID=1917164 RepID=UPI00097086C6|nr:MFS transporter [Shewanella sp. UCD-KL21]